MAEFCVQCAEEHNFEQSDFVGGKEHCLRSVICEGCGPTIVDHNGRCIADCLEHHGIKYHLDGETWKRGKKEKTMAKYRKVGGVVEASQWFKKGDHPQVMMNNYRWPDIHDDVICGKCGQKLGVHGWVDTSGDEGFAVCPGSFIIVEKGGHIYYQHPDSFNKNFEKIKHEIDTTLQQLVDLVEAQKELIAAKGLEVIELKKELEEAKEQGDGG